MHSFFRHGQAFGLNQAVISVGLHSERVVDRRDSVRRAPVEPDGRRVRSRAIALDEDEVAIAGGGLVAIAALGGELE